MMLVEGPMRVELADDKMTAWLCVDSPEEAGRYASGDSLAGALRSEGIKFGVDMPTVAKAVRRAAEAEQGVDRIVIATGMPAVPSRGVRYELRFNPDDFSAAAEDVPVLQILARQVEKGQLLAERLPSQKGTPGINVLGEMVKVGNGDDERLRAEAGVTSVDNGRQFLAARPGIPAAHTHALRVDPAYIVEKDLDLAYGDITFTGHVFVIGTIVDGLSLEAGQNAYVAGHVEGGSVKTGGDVLVHGGVTGSSGSQVIVGGTIRARYAQNAQIQAGQDVLVTNSILNSSVNAYGKVVVLGEKGQIAGGKIEAFRGIECREAGTERGRQTVLNIGEPPGRIDVPSVGEIRRLDQEIRRLSERLDPILDRVSDINALPSYQKLALRRCLERRESLIALRKSKAAQAAPTPARAPWAGEPPYLKVQGPIYPGVRVSMCGKQFEVSSTASNVLIYFKDGKIRAKALSGNDTKRNDHDHT